MIVANMHMYSNDTGHDWNRVPYNGDIDNLEKMSVHAPQKQCDALLQLSHYKHLLRQSIPESSKPLFIWSSVKEQKVIMRQSGSVSKRTVFFFFFFRFSLYKVFDKTICILSHNHASILRVKTETYNPL